MATASKLLTYEEWLKRPEIEDLEEVVDGEIRFPPIPKVRHAFAVEDAASELSKSLDRKETIVIAGRFGLVICREPLTTRMPDIAIFMKSRIVERDGFIHSSPELIAEVLSPEGPRREQQRKLQDYESFGVPEVWIISPEARTIEVLQLHEGQLITTSIVNSGELRPKLFPEAAVDVAAIWED